MLVAALAAASAAAVEIRAQQVAEEARKVLADPGYQRDLPGVGERTAKKEERSPAEAGSSGGEGPVMASPVLQAAGATAMLARLVIWVLGAVALVLLVIWVASAFKGRSKAEATPDAGRGDGDGPAANEPSWLPGDAARLAAEGRFGEALHVLLLVAIRQIGERSPRGVEPSRTSRELVRLVPLSPDGRRSFEALVRLVEVTLFGGVAAGAEEYDQGLAHFRAVSGGRV